MGSDQDPSSPSTPSSAETVRRLEPLPTPAGVRSYELDERGLQVQRQVAIPVAYGDVRLDEGFRADLLVEDAVIVELKSVARVAPVHNKQILTYIRLANRRVGLLLNFGEVVLRDGITRVVNGLAEP